MSMQAVGTYIKTLRERQGMTANELSVATGLNVTYIWRIESGDTEDPGLQRISKIVAAVKGRGDHIIKLLLHPQPSEAYIQELANEARLTSAERDAAASFLTTDQETRALLEAVHEKAADPALRNRIRGYVDSLNAGDVAPPSPAPRRTSRRQRGG
jgi:transcriptional regulator with XRE-family HTH domain